MAEHLLKMHEAEKQVREDGQKEYAHDENNAFRNFQQTAKDIGVTQEKALWVHMKKHLDGILTYINGHKSQRESVHGRIKDARMYLALLDGMIAEGEEVEEMKELSLRQNALGNIANLGQANPLLGSEQRWGLDP